MARKKEKLLPDCCASCKHFVDDPAVLEALFKGINSLSSVRGESRGDAGICRLHDRYLLPVHSCPEFVRKSDTR